jgi:hypothetical protein
MYFFCPNLYFYTYKNGETKEEQLGCLKMHPLSKNPIKSLNLAHLILKTKNMSELALKWGKEAKEKRLIRLDLGNKIFIVTKK